MALSSEIGASGGPPAASAQRTATLWAVASGKGGAGKSVVAANLAVGLARLEGSAVAVDLDLGGANLHDLFGRERSPLTVADALRGLVGACAEAVVPTAAPGVALLSGSRAPLDVASPSRRRHQKLLAELRHVGARHVVADLGAGSQARTLDAFLAADRRILVVTPERTSVENARHFLEAAFFRSLRGVVRDVAVRSALRAVLDEARIRGMSPRDMAEAASRKSVAAGSRLRDAVRRFEVELVVNRAATGTRDPGPALERACRDELGVRLRLLATLPEDSSVPASVERGVPVTQLFPDSGFSRGLVAMLEQTLGAESSAAPRPLPPPGSPAARAGRAGETARPAQPDFGGRAPGAYLRQCRERLGLGLADVCERTRIRQLPDIERERFGALPPDLHLREFVRQYAELLGCPEPARIARCYVEIAQAQRGDPPRGHHARNAGLVALGSRWLRREVPEPTAASAASPRSAGPAGAEPLGVDALVSAALSEELGAEIEVEAAPETAAAGAEPPAARPRARRRRRFRG